MMPLSENSTVHGSPPIAPNKFNEGGEVGVKTGNEARTEGRSEEMEGGGGERGGEEKEEAQRDREGRVNTQVWNYVTPLHTTNLCMK